MKRLDTTKKIKVCLTLLLISILFVSGVFTVSADENSVYLGGFAAGFTINTRGAEVIALSDVVTEDGVTSPCKEADIKPGDVILSIGDIKTDEYADVQNVLDKCKGAPVELKVLRGGETIVKTVLPAKDLSGKYKLGLLLRDKLTGIGTVTFIKDNKEFMALGHAVCSENGKPIEIVGGNLYACSIFAVEKGQRGKAGELRGMFLSDASIGVIDKNLTVGIKGSVKDDFDLKKLNRIKVGEAHPGKASIVTTVNGIIPEEFSISIVKVDADKKDNRNFVISVTDKKLNEYAGGIVQGMSGSPIVQDGKLVGAVTHVFISDSTKGFGIAIDKMLAN